MPKSQDSLNADLYDLLISRGLQPETMDSNGKVTPVPETAEVFQFQYTKNGNDYGTVTVTVDGVNDLIVYYNDEILSGSSFEESGWIDFIKHLKRFAHKRQLGFKLKDLDRLKNDMKKRQYNKGLNEGYYGTRNTSYSDNGPSTIKMIIKHNKPIGEGDQRFRHIERIFLENEHGERILAPTTKPSVGRVFARHLAEGGEYNDDRWSHIKQLNEDIGKLGGFVRATRRKQFNESATRMINEAVEQYQQLRETMKRLSTSRGYNSYFESWTPTLLEDSEENLSDLFRSSSIDPRIEAALPVLGRLNIRLSEMQEANEFESWASSVIDEALDGPMVEDFDVETRGQKDELIDLLGPESEAMPVGPDAMSAIGELDGLINDDELNVRLKKAARNNPDSDARPIVIAWMQENADDPEFEKVLSKLEPEENEMPAPKAPAPKSPEEKPEEPDDLPPPPPPVNEDDGFLSHIRKLSGLK